MIMAEELQGLLDRIQKDGIDKADAEASQIVEAANRLIEKYSPQSIVVDPARSGNALVAEINQRWGLGAKTAQKREKAEAMKLLKNDILSGHVFCLEDSRLAPQLRSLRWNKTFTREAEGIVCDLADAWLYLYRESFHWLHEEKQEAPEQGSPDYYQALEASQIEREEASYRQELQDLEVDFY